MTTIKSFVTSFALLQVSFTIVLSWPNNNYSFETLEIKCIQHCCSHFFVKIEEFLLQLSGSILFWKEKKKIQHLYDPVLLLSLSPSRNSFWSWKPSLIGSGGGRWLSTAAPWLPTHWLANRQLATQHLAETFRFLSPRWSSPTFRAPTKKYFVLWRF